MFFSSKDLRYSIGKYRC